MERWESIEEQEIFDMTVKMYRDPYEADDTFLAPYDASELDNYAFKHLGSELFMYRITPVSDLTG